MAKRKHKRGRAAKGITLLNRADPMAPLRNKLRSLAGPRGEWAGIPMPLGGEDLIVEPSHPLAKALSKCADPGDDDGWRLRNTFWSWTKRSTILVMEKDGKITFGLTPGIHGLKHALQTLGCSDAWGLEQESKALNTLASHLSHRQFKQYLLTGSFIETSKRSRIAYMFRKLRPTVAISTGGGESRVLAALCMHPIAYYADSWAGAMCPTDDVIAHLMLMRGDEPMLWRRSNQHPAHMKEAGL